MTLIRASRWLLLARIDDQWFSYYAWADLLRDLPLDGQRIRVQAVR